MLQDIKRHHPRIPSMFTTALLLGSLIIQTSYAVSSVRISLELHQFSNPEGKGDNGACCETVSLLNHLGCGSSCDTYLIIVFYKKTSAGELNMLSFVQTQTWINTNNIAFGSTLGNHVFNPIEIEQESWNTHGYKVMIAAHDYDHIRHDLLGRWTRDYDHPKLNFTWNFDGSNSIKLVASIHSACINNYYGPDCSTKCVETAQYTCDQTTGQMICRPGYSGNYCRNYDPCSLKTCANGGRCTVRGNLAICFCRSGYTGLECETNIDECFSDPCNNGGTCHDMINGWRCICPSWYTGTYCETRIDNCRGVTCQNNGTCMTSIDSYRCHCKPGYAGRHCEENIDDCKGVSCLHGTCVDGIDEFHCICERGYTGPKCEVDVNECSSNPCQNGGSCFDQVNRFSCGCKEGWTGLLCETDIDECVYTSCGNGTCLNTPGSRVCVCNEYYRGSHCEVYVNGCDINPCINGQCKAVRGDNSDTITCNCDPGYDGQLCEIEIDECASHPCLNNGKCEDEVNGYGCLCSDGYSGVNCESEPTPCYSSPCLNNSTCVELGQHEYECQCPQYYTGSNCEEKIRSCDSNPCMHGDCHEKEGGFLCLCYSGFTGNTCESAFDYCNSQPCTGNNNCFNSSTGFICSFAGALLNNALNTKDASSMQRSEYIPLYCICENSNNTSCDCIFPWLLQMQCTANSSYFIDALATNLCLHLPKNKKDRCKDVEIVRIQNFIIEKSKDCFAVDNLSCTTQQVRLESLESTQDCQNDTSCIQQRKYMFCLQPITKEIAEPLDQVVSYETINPMETLERYWYIIVPAVVALIVILLVVTIKCTYLSNKSNNSKERGLKDMRESTKSKEKEMPLECMEDHIYEGTTYYTNSAFDTTNSPPAVNVFYSEATLQRNKMGTADPPENLYAEPLLLKPTQTLDDNCVYSEPDLNNFPPPVPKSRPTQKPTTPPPLPLSFPPMQTTCKDTPWLRHSTSPPSIEFPAPPSPSMLINEDNLQAADHQYDFIPYNMEGRLQTRENPLYYASNAINGSNEHIQPDTVQRRSNPLYNTVKVIK